MLLAQSEKKLGSIFQILLNVESTFEMEIVLIAKIEQLTKQKRFLSRKLKLEEKSTGSVNENASPKNVIHFIAAPFIYTKHKWLFSTGDPKAEKTLYFNRLRRVELFSTFPTFYTFETTP